jgi:predicted MFS family arabinose efflux permease
LKIPVLMSGVTIALTTADESLSAVALLLAAWGLLGTPAPVGWGTWLTRALPADAEAGGGLMVATIQFAITLGASVGGIVFDSHGYRATFGLGSGVLAFGALLAFLATAGGKFRTATPDAMPPAPSSSPTCGLLSRRQCLQPTLMPPAWQSARDTPRATRGSEA